MKCSVPFFSEQMGDGWAQLNWTQQCAGHEVRAETAPDCVETLDPYETKLIIARPNAPLLNILHGQEKWRCVWLANIS